MPNWCDNKLIITGSEEAFLTFYTENQQFDFNKIISIPIENNRIDLFSYRVNSWGTKWNASDVVWEDNIVYFHTAWSPAVPIIQRLVEQYPNLKFDYTYYECGNQYAGHFYFNKDKYVLEEIPESMIPEFTVKHGFETKEFWGI